MTTEITPREAAHEINRLNRELLFQRQAELIEANNQIIELTARFREYKEDAKVAFGLAKEAAEQAISERDRLQAQVSQLLTQSDEREREMFEQFERAEKARQGAEADAQRCRAALIELDKHVDFGMPIHPREPYLFDDPSGINAAYEQARAAIGQGKEGSDAQER